MTMNELAAAVEVEELYLEEIELASIEAAAETYDRFHNDYEYDPMIEKMRRSKPRRFEDYR